MAQARDTRRRGDQLQNEIYQAVYELLDEKGYASLTLADVAGRSKTSRSVLYRHWDNIFDLTLDAILAGISTETNPLVQGIFDRGSLRADLLYVGQTFIRLSNQGPNKYFRLLFAEAPEAQLNREKILAASETSNLKIMGVVLENGRRRGEIHKEPPVMTQLMLFRSLRYFDLIGGRSMAVAYLDRIVDEEVLPAWRTFIKEESVT
ncbi:TetR/AcrR family transcriptional regulator [Furfurilactobacillus entadae]|uniref:TetR/AcrR family transcriptional regulator n=1 Tax=Furfurilactobacillus entadae TaxID=2922307 RepID=UPI0035EC80AB